MRQCTSSRRCGNIMGKQQICTKCSKVLANRHSLSRHRNMYCKSRHFRSSDALKQHEELSTIDDKINRNNVESIYKGSEKKISLNESGEKAENPSLAANSERNFETESDSDESESTEFMTNNPEDLKTEFRYLYRELCQNIERYNKLVLILHHLRHMGYLTEEEYNAMIANVQKKVGIL